MDARFYVKPWNLLLFHHIVQKHINQSASQTLNNYRSPEVHSCQSPYMCVQDHRLIELLYHLHCHNLYLQDSEFLLDLQKRHTKVNLGQDLSECERQAYIPKTDKLRDII